MAILNLHGLNGSRNNTNYSILCEKFGEGAVISPQIDYEIDSPELIIHNILSSCPAPDLIVGNSFGGFFAYIIGSIAGAKTLLVNPCIPPHEYIPNLVSDYKYTGMLESLWGTYADTNNDYFMILGSEDDVLNIDTTLNYLKPTDNRFTIISGGHSLKGEEFIRVFKEHLT